MIILIIFISVFVITFLKCAFSAFWNGFKDEWNKAPPDNEIDDTSEINRLERIENYDRQIDGYTQLIKLLDTEYKTETDNRKRAAILSKQLTTLEKLNKTIEKREKLDY